MREACDLEFLLHDSHRHAVTAAVLGTPAGSSEPGSGAKSMMASRPPGFKEATKLLLKASTDVTWW